MGTCQPNYEPTTVVCRAATTDRWITIKCYLGKDLKNPKFTKVTAATSDQVVANEAVEVQKVKFVCTPVDKNGEGINDPNAHLTCYQIKASTLSVRPNLQVRTQFQSSQFQVKKGKLLCVPSTKTILP